MSVEFWKILSVIIGVLAFLFALYRYRKDNPVFSFSMFQHFESNTDGCGSYLCARVNITNSGGKTGTFNGFIAIDQKGEEFYPMHTLKAGTEIGPFRTASSAIPIGHLLDQPIKHLYMIDGLIKKRKIPNKHVKKTIISLKKEKKRYEQHGFPIHPSNGIEDST